MEQLEILFLKYNQLPREDIEKCKERVDEALLGLKATNQSLPDDSSLARDFITR